MNWATSSRIVRRSACACVGVLSGVALFVSACGSSNSAARPRAGTCPDKADEIAALDVARQYDVTPAAGATLRAALLTATELNALSDKLDADFGVACAGIAKDLGVTGDWRSGNEACTATLTALRATRDKLGGTAHTKLLVGEPACGVDLALMTKCASLCDSAASADKVHADCATQAGRCEGACNGSCKPGTPAKCDGVCSGTCEGTFKGECTGRCVGTCDGKRSSAACSGTCAGTCERGMARGECKGTCSGSCRLGNGGACAGRCSGECSVELIEPKCAGDFTLPAVSESCRVRCQLAVMNQRQCSAPAVGMLSTSTELDFALSRSVPALLKVVHELGGNGVAHVSAGQAAVESARRTVAELAHGDASSSLMTCFDPPLKAAGVAAVTVKAAIAQATAIQEELAK